MVKQEHDMAMAMDMAMQEAAFTNKLKETLMSTQNDLLRQQNDLVHERMELESLKESVQRERAALEEEKRQAASDRLEVLFCFYFLKNQTKN